MKQKRRKPKIITKNKSYPVCDSVFYKLSNKKKLAKLLGSSISELKVLTADGHYHCFLQTKDGKSRHIQEPKTRLDRVHTRIASLLCRIDTFDGLHSGRKGHSNITNAKVHVGAGKKVLTADIKSFFGTTTRLNVFDFFYNSMDCSSDVADLLSNILTYKEHVPTGSRVSMPLAYFANKKMFDEIECAARKTGARMTLFVDDLTFSGILLKQSFTKTVEMLASKYGHKIHPSKTRFYGADEVKLITGAAVVGNQLKPRNKHLASLNQDLEAWLDNSCNDKSLVSRVIGRMTFIGSIDPRYKDKARTFRRASTAKHS